MCLCDRTEVRQRMIRGGGIQHVRQCLDCGELVGSAIKKTGQVPVFDESLRIKKREQNSTNREQAKAVEKQIWTSAYDAYLQSPEWKALRAKVLLRDKGVCQGCLNAPAAVVHHLSYDHVQNELAFELISLCAECHNRIHAKE